MIDVVVFSLFIFCWFLWVTKIIIQVIITQKLISYCIIILVTLSIHHFFMYASSMLKTGTCKMDKIIGKLNHWTLFRYKNLLGLFSRKGDICQIWKSTRLKFWVPVPKVVEVITIILIPSCSYVSCYFKICP